jgi:hypothetical protein
MRLILTTIVPLLSIAPHAARAAHPLATDDTGTQGAHRYQLELTAEHGRDASASAGLTRTDVAGQAAAALSLGLGETVDVVVGLPTAWSSTRVEGALVSDQAGLSDGSLEVKWRFLARGGFSAAVKPGLSLPLGDPRRGLGAGRTGYGVTLIASQEAGPVTLHLNGGWSRARYLLPEDEAASRRDTWGGSFAAAVKVAPGLQVMADVGLESPAERDASAWPAFALVGAVYTLSDRLDVDAGVRTALNSADTDLVVLVGAAWHLGGAR